MRRVTEKSPRQHDIMVTFSDENYYKRRSGSHEKHMHRKSITYDIRMKVSYSVCAELPQEGDLWEIEDGYRSYTTRVMPAQKVEIIATEACPDHIHMYVSVPPKLSVSSFVGFLKGKSTLVIFE